MKRISADDAERIVSQMSTTPGFIDISVASKGHRVVSAYPARHWTVPAIEPEFSRFVQTLEAAWNSYSTPGREPDCAGGIIGTLFYEAGTLTVPGFHSPRRPQREDQGFVGLYLWQLTIPGLDQGSATPAELSFHRDCDPQTRQRVLGLLESPKVAPAPFRITQPFSGDQPAESYRQGVNRVLELINAGDCYQVNLSNKYSGQYQGSPYTAFRALCQAVPVPYSAYISTEDYQVLSISPELFLNIRDGQTVTSKPIKGTRPRDHQSSERDREIAQSLAHAEKDRAENLMIVDLIRNDLSRFCEPFSVGVSKLFDIESYENVHQLVSTVEGTLRREVTPLRALLSAFPGGSITGAPKRRAMEVIDELEAHHRGPYCGSVFYWDFQDNLESNIAIRTLMTEASGAIHCWAGCGIVADSDPEEEYQESVNKVGKLMEILEAH